MKNFWGKFKKNKRPIMVQAPMSGVSDQAFRLMFAKYGSPDVFWTEFISASALFSPKAQKYCFDVLKFSKKERPIVAQIFGANLEELEKAAKVIAKLGFDGIDINMGCPNRNVEKQGAGSALIKNSEQAVKVIRAVKKGAGKLAISVKTRIGYNKNEIADWIPVILKETGLDGIMIGRAVLGNPWFYVDKKPTLLEILNAIIQHSELLGKEKHWDSIKKHFHAYCKNFIGSKDLRNSLMKTKNAKEAKEVVKKFIKNYKIVI